MGWRAVLELPYYIGALLPQVCLPLTPCIGAFFRGYIRARFKIPSKSWTFDVLVWICCLPCAAIQEAKHADEMAKIAYEEELAMQKDLERKQAREAQQKHLDNLERTGQTPTKLGHTEAHNADGYKDEKPKNATGNPANANNRRTLGLGPK